MRPLVLFLLFMAPEVFGDDGPLTIAVASNFVRTANEIAEVYSRESGVSVRIVAGSTGKLYAQIVNGAPFDVFMSADDRRPGLLEDAGLVADGARLTYAFGVLSVFTTRQDFAETCASALRRAEYSRLAIANPAVAPYGRAAQQYLERQGLWDAYASRLVQGQNVMQATQFVATGNADAGIGWPGRADVSCQQALPRSDYDPIPQQAVVLRRSKQSAAAREFLAILESERAIDLIRSAGYGVVEQ